MTPTPDSTDTPGDPGGSAAPALAVVAVRRMGGCAAISDDGASICIMDIDHEGDHGWQPQEPPLAIRRGSWPGDPLRGTYTSRPESPPVPTYYRESDTGRLKTWDGYVWLDVTEAYDRVVRSTGGPSGSSHDWVADRPAHVGEGVWPATGPASLGWDLPIPPQPLDGPGIPESGWRRYIPPLGSSQPLSGSPEPGRSRITCSEGYDHLLDPPAHRSAVGQPLVPGPAAPVPPWVVEVDVRIPEGWIVSPAANQMTVDAEGTCVRCGVPDVDCMCEGVDGLYIRHPSGAVLVVDMRRDGRWDVWTIGRPS